MGVGAYVANVRQSDMKHAIRRIRDCSSEDRAELMQIIDAKHFSVSKIPGNKRLDLIDATLHYMTVDSFLPEQYHPQALIFWGTSDVYLERGKP